MKKAFVYLIAICLVGTSCSLQAKTSSEQTRRHRRHQDDTNEKDEPNSKKLHKKIRKRGSAKADKETQAKEAKAAKMRNIQLGIFVTILVSGGCAYVILSDPTKSPEYPERYQAGKKMVDERIQNAINAQSSLKKGVNADLSVDNNIQPVFITKPSTYCFACTDTKSEVLETTHKGSGSVCKGCYDEYATYKQQIKPVQPPLYHFFKNLSESGSHFYKPFDLNDKSGNGKKTDHPAYLTTEDMAALGAPKDMIKGYRDNLGRIRMIKGHCVLCGGKGHIGKDCPNKENIAHQIAHWYALHGDRGIRNRLQMFMSKFGWNMSWEDDRPCPGEKCGFLIKKYDGCNTVDCQACGLKFNWSLGYIGKKEKHTYEPYRVYVIKKKVMPYQTFNPNLWMTEDVGKKKK